MKAGILTFHNAHNYGAALQVFATQTWLSRQGYDCEVINYRIEKIDHSYENTSQKRRHSFEDFMKKKLHLSPLYKTLSELQKAELPYDVIVAGSDQIWNAGILGGLNAAYFCNVGKPEARRIVYAASLGSDTLSPSNRFLLPRLLQFPDFISVREASMIDLIQPLTEKKLTTVLDPTFLLDLSDYEKLVVKQNRNTPYIYLHYVHHTGENPWLDLAARLLSEKTGLPILKNRIGKRFANELPSCQDNGPGEFLGTLSDATYVITDSFHATVFSILFHKHFLTVAPVKRPERLIELLSLLGLSSHLYQENFSPEEFLGLPSYRESLPSLLSSLRQDSIDFLEHALHAPIEKKRVDYFEASNPYLCNGCGACVALAKRSDENVSNQTKANGGISFDSFSNPSTDASCSLLLTKDEENFLYPTIVKSSSSLFSKKAATDKPLVSSQNNPLPSVCIFDSVGSSPSELKNKALFFRTKAKSTGLAVYHKDLYERMISYEGGFLTEVIRKVHRDGGIMIGKIFDAKTGECHYVASTSEELSLQFLRFRPQEADATELHHVLSDLFSKKEELTGELLIESEDLDTEASEPIGPIVLFSTPCHIAALYECFPDWMERIITIEQGCDGITSALPVTRYAKLLEEEEGTPVIDYDFFAKHYGKSGIRAEFTHADGSLSSQFISECNLVRAYQTSAMQRPACYNCSFRLIGHGIADITLATCRYALVSDFAPEDRIVSALLFHTNRGEDFFSTIKDAFHILPLTEELIEITFQKAPLKLTASRPLLYDRLAQGLDKRAFAAFEKK